MCVFECVCAYAQDTSLAKKKKRSKISSPPSRSYKSKTKKKLSKKPIYDSDSSSLSEGEIASDEEPKKKQNRKRPSKKYDMSDDSSDSDASEIQSPVQETIQRKLQHSFILYTNFSSHYNNSFIQFNI